MKFLKLLAMSVLFVLALTPARSQNNISLRVQIPFSFFAGGKELPPGDYVIQQASDSGLMVVHGQEGQTVSLLTMYVVPNSTEVAGAAFASVGGQKYLNRIQLTDGSVRQVLVHNMK